MINPLPNNSEDSLKIFYHLTEETRYPALILFILSIVICLSISKGLSTNPKLKSCVSQKDIQSRLGIHQSRANCHDQKRKLMGKSRFLGNFISI